MATIIKNCHISSCAETTLNCIKATLLNNQKDIYILNCRIYTIGTIYLDIFTKSHYNSVIYIKNNVELIVINKDLECFILDKKVSKEEADEAIKDYEKIFYRNKIIKEIIE